MAGQVRISVKSEFRASGNGPKRLLLVTRYSTDTCLTGLRKITKSLSITNNLDGNRNRLCRTRKMAVLFLSQQSETLHLLRQMYKSW